MLKKILSTFLIISLLVNLRATADEGMWIPLLLKSLNYRDMKRMGLQLTAEEIYSINKSSIKDAIVQLGNGCTGVIVSKDGLLLTNHHCAYHYIQSHSTVEHNYLAEGFWAMTREEELTNEGLAVKFLVRIEDVTDKILSELHDTLTERERNEKIFELSGKISKLATKDTYYDACVKSFFAGSEYYLFVYEIYKDVRLVGAPPSAIGKFGGNTDNWMWPRHSGDFAVFRVYMSPDGKPAKYSPDNIPYKSKYHLPITLNGVKENDFSMILGYASTLGFQDLDVVKLIALKDLADEDEISEADVKAVIDSIAKDKPYLLGSEDTTKVGAGNFEGGTKTEGEKTADELLKDVIVKSVNF